MAASFYKVWPLETLFYKFTNLLKVPYYLISIIWAFLNYRTFKVKIEGGGESSIRKFICGVPQGARVLSPTLFSVYLVNEVPLADGENEKTLLTLCTYSSIVLGTDTGS